MEKGKEKAAGPDWKAVGLAVLAYFLVQQIGHLFPDSRNAIAAFWPAAGIGLAAFLLVPRASWPLLAAALYLAGNASNILAGQSLPASLGFMVANLLESWLSALVVLALGSRKGSFDRPADFLALGLAAFGVNAATALVGAGSSAIVTASSFASAWFAWWLADGFGILLVTPLVIAWKELPRKGLAGKTRPVPEYAAFFALWTAAAWLTFNHGGSVLAGPQPYLLALLLAWPALRFGLRSLSLSLLILAAITFLSSAVTEGPSPLGGGTATERLLLLEAFVGVLSMTTYLLWASFAELRTAKAEAEATLNTLRAVGDNIPDGLVYQLRIEKEGSRRFTYLSSGMAKLLGLDPESVKQDPELYYSRIHPDDRRMNDEHSAEAILKRSDFHSTVRFLYADGLYHRVQIGSSPQPLEDGATLWNGVHLDVTRLRTAEDELRASEASYRSLFERASDGILISDGDGRFVEVNEACCSMLGYAKEEILGLGAGDLALPADLERLPSPLSTLNAGETLRWERRLRRKDGSALETEMSAKGMEDGRVMAIMRDISARKWTESLARLRLELTESVGAGKLGDLLGLIVDEAERATASGLAFFHLVAENQVDISWQGWSEGTKARECPGGLPQGHAPLDSAGLWGDAVRKHRAIVNNDYQASPGTRGLPAGHGPIRRFLVVPVLRDGLAMAVIGVANKEVDYGPGDVARLGELGSLAKDIIGRQRTHDLLAETEERFASVFRASPLPATLTRFETGEFIDVNDAFLGTFGWSREELIGRTGLAIGLYEDPLEREEALGLLRKTPHRATAVERRLWTRDGRVLECVAGYGMIHIKGEHFLVAQMQDLTERKRAEEKVRKALAEKEVLLRELYHRANNNMQVISALLEFQSVEIGDERLTRALGDTQDRIGSMALVNRKLYEAKDLSHIELHEYIGELAQQLSRSYGDGAGRIRVVTALESVRVLIDTAVPCGLILNELISNVFKHAYPGDREGELHLGLSRDEAGWISLRVADHGVGVPAGFDFARDGRVGIQSIVGLCAEQLRGEVLFDRSGGLACEIRFRDDLYEARV